MALPLIEIGPLIMWALAFALCISVVYVSKAFFGVTGTVLGKLPIIGGWVDATAHKIEERISNVFGDLASRFEARVGASWHATARLIDRMGHEIASHSSILHTLANLVIGLTVPGQQGRLIHALQKMLHGAQSLTHAATERISGVEQRVARGIGADVLPRIRALEREVSSEVVRERTRARTAERAADREITNLWKWARTHTLAAGTLAFAGAVSLALSRLGLGWLRCPSLGRLGKRIGCGGFAALDDLLFGAVTALAVTDLCEFSALAYTAAEEMTPLLIGLVDVENALIGCHGATAPPALRLRALSLPPVRDPLPLAA